ncbi:MAG: TauD/TfdA family dioxygenase [Proteobacteria bacterium]|nr:TauD/TfdA family dioxygenase [Pseudomonadota bacterium]
MKVLPSGGPLGATITGVDFSTDVSAADKGLIVEAFLDHMVVVFPNQKLDYHDMLRLSEIYGPRGQTSNELMGLGRKSYLSDDIPDGITIISNIRNENGALIGSLGNAEAWWHTDSSFTEEPISASLLHALEVPDEGGETEFLNMAQAFDAMPTHLAAKIAGKIANHSKIHSPDGTRREAFEDVSDPSKAPGAMHPMVRTHPQTGRKCLYLGVRRHSYITGMAVSDSEVLLDEIWAHTCQEKYVWSHKWTLGDLVVWDNRCTMHHRNAFPADARRLMIKSITAGEAVT